jgi:hypothetical protein
VQQVFIDSSDEIVASKRIIQLSRQAIIAARATVAESKALVENARDALSRAQAQRRRSNRPANRAHYS